MDLVADQLFNYKWFRTLAVEDVFTRECILTHVGQSIKDVAAIHAFEHCFATHSKPRSIQVDNRPEFMSKGLDLWASQQGMNLVFSCPGKPTDNAYIESFNGSFQEECLQTHWFLSLEDATMKIDLSRKE